MKKLFKRKAFWLTAVPIIVILAIVALQANKPQEEELITAPVQRGSLSQTVTATGKIESASETNLNFSVSGKLWQLTVTEGERVQGGQLLAQLDSAQPISQVAAANAKVAEAQADLNKVLAGASHEDLEVSRQSVSAAQAALEAAKTAWLNAVASQNQALINLKNDVLDNGADAIFSVKEALHKVDDILSSAYADYLGGTNRNSYYQTESQYTATETLLNQADDDFDLYSIENTVADLSAVAVQILSTLNSTAGLLDNAYEMMLKSVPAGGLTQAQIDTYKSSLETEQASLATKISALQSAKSDLEAETLSDQAGVDEAQAKLDQAAEDLSLKQAQLALKGAGPRDFEIELYQARLKAAQANLQAALADLENYRLRAPIAGLVTNINYEIGEFVSSAQPLFSLIGESNLEINVDVPESDISKIKVGDQAEITLDAFGDDNMFQGHIAFVDPAETIINDVVYYQVKVTFDQKEEQVKSGMTANVTVLTDSRTDVLYVPARAVIVKDNQRLVRILENGQQTEKPVVTGLRGDDGLIEILDGLKEGENVITYIKNGK